MTIWLQQFRKLLLLSLLVTIGCGALDQTAKKNPNLGLITTPPSYYTTQKGKYLGQKYKNNLDRIVERIVRNPKTANLQFANNIASFGGIGFFTHSATSSVDERFLEVIIGAPETFDTKLDYSAKVYRLFSLYGAELLSILASDHEIDQEKQVDGYGLNLSWRNVVPDDTGPRIALERAVLYLSKSIVRSFLKGDLTQNNLLGEAIIFAAAEAGPMKLVSYRPHELRPDSRSPIHEETLAKGKVSSKPDVTSPAAVGVAPVANPSIARAQEKSAPETSFANQEDNTKRTALVEKSHDTSAALSAVPVEAFKPKRAPGNEIREPVVDNQETADHASTLASVERKKTDGQTTMTKGDLQAADISLVAPSFGNPADAEMPSDEQNKEPAGTEIKPASKKSSLARPSPPVLHGFIVQVAFAERHEAQRWAETLERRGHTVSMTEAASGASVRLRIGSFTRREEAERQLQALRQDGLKGIILNFPQAYRPELRPSAAPGSEESVSVVQ